MFLKKDLRSWGRQQKKTGRAGRFNARVWRSDITSQREDWPGSVTSSCSEAFENRWSQQIRRRSGQMNTPQGTSQCCVWKQLFSRFNYHSTALSYSPGLESSDCHAPRSSMFTAVPRQQEWRHWDGSDRSQRCDWQNAKQAVHHEDSVRAPQVCPLWAAGAPARLGAGLWLGSTQAAGRHLPLHNLGVLATQA